MIVEDSDYAMTILSEMGFTRGLARAIQQQCSSSSSSSDSSDSMPLLPLRIWVVDNSGSMRTVDGRQLIDTNQRHDVRWKVSTRWSELQQTVEYHAQMAGLLYAKTEFRMLNSPGRNYGQSFSVAELGPDFVENELDAIFQMLQQVEPFGVTPLTQHLHDIYSTIKPLEPALRRNGQRVAVVLATDGVPTDARGNPDTLGFRRALTKLLTELPVWCVVRLCTDEAGVLEYYQELDDELELSLEVLDDFADEAREVYRKNPWLAYGLPLHRCREMGFPHRLLDLLDERRLTLDEVFEFTQLLFGEEEIRTDPHVDWGTFVEELKRAMHYGNRDYKTWNPMWKTATHWIDLWRLHRCYGPNKYLLEKIVAVIVVVVALLIKLFMG